MPYRRSIRLKEYNYKSDGAYFVTLCTADRAPIITAVRERILKRELRSLEERFPGVHVDFFIFMKNHVHCIFLFEDSVVPLPQVIQVFKSKTTIAIRRLGYLPKIFWQKNYYEHIIRDADAFNIIREYIRCNPEVEVVRMEEIVKLKRSSARQQIDK